MKDQKVTEFYKSLDFMKLGQAVHKGNWQVAAMTLRRMDNRIKELELTELAINFQRLRQCINGKDRQAAKQILAVVIAKRAKYLNTLHENREP